VVSALPPLDRTWPIVLPGARARVRPRTPPGRPWLAPPCRRHRVLGCTTAFFLTGEVDGRQRRLERWPSERAASLNAYRPWTAQAATHVASCNENPCIPTATVSGTARNGFLGFPERMPFEYPSTPSPAPILEPQQFWKMAQREVHWRKQTMSSILFGIAALIASIGLLVLCSGIGIYFLSNSKSKLAGRL